MEISQQDEQYVIRIPMNSIDARTLEKLLRQLRAEELLAARQGTDEQATQLANEVGGDWWSRNRHRFAS